MFLLNIMKSRFKIQLKRAKKDWIKNKDEADAIFLIILIRCALGRIILDSFSPAAAVFSLSNFTVSDYMVHG